MINGLRKKIMTTILHSEISSVFTSSKAMFVSVVRKVLDISSFYSSLVIGYGYES